MKEPDIQPSTTSAIPGKSTHPDRLGESLQAACHQIVAGRNAARRIAAMVRHFALSEAEFRLLWQLHRCDPMRNREKFSLPSESRSARDQTSLQTELALSPSQISELVERMRIKGWITRETDPEDRRRHLLGLTELGHALLNKVLVHMQASLFQWPLTRASDLLKRSGREKAA